MPSDRKLAKKAYEAWRRRRDPVHWKTNHPSWEKLNSYAQNTWVIAAEVFREVLDADVRR